MHIWISEEAGYKLYPTGEQKIWQRKLFPAWARRCLSVLEEENSDGCKFTSENPWRAKRAEQKEREKREKRPKSEH